MKDEFIVGSDREILEAWSAGPEDDLVGARVGYRGVTWIEPYREDGQMAGVPWLRVWKDEKLVARLNCAHMAQIRYKE